MKKIVVTGTRGIPGVMGGVETHCEELFPRLAQQGWDVTVVRRSDYVKDGLKKWKGVRLVTLPSPKKKSFEAIIHTFRAITKPGGWGLTSYMSTPSVPPCSYRMPRCWG